MDVLTDASATSLARAIRGKQVSSVEVVRAHLERIAELNPRLNAVVQLDPEAALDQARRADASLAAGESIGPFHGVPVTVKDAIEVEGVVSSGGTMGRSKFVPRRDASVVARLRQAGAVLLAKTNVPEASAGFETDNPVYGRTNNPYDLSRTPAGSSGGEAALIASGGSPLGLGSDAGGSIRMPCHFCGIAGIKPTSGRVPRTGHWPSLNGLYDSLTQIGPMSRSVEDLAPVLEVIAGPDWRDPHVVPAPLGSPDDLEIGTLRAAFFTDNGVSAADQETAEVVRSAAAVLADAGVEVAEDRPAVVEQSFELYNSIWRADAGASFRDLLEAAGTMEIEGPLMTSLLEHLDTEPVSTAELGRLLVRWDEFRSSMLRFMEDYDVLLGPVNARPAVVHGTSYHSYPDFSYTFADNLTGWPAAVVRCGVSEQGLPIGVHVTSRPWREDVALAVAGLLDSALGGWQAPPI